MTDDNNNGTTIDFDEWKKKKKAEGKRLRVAPPPDVTRAALEDLGSLSPVQYGQRRDELADKLAVSRLQLDEEYKERRKQSKAGAGTSAAGNDFFCVVDPWPDEVDGAGLLTNLDAAAKAHLVLPAGAAEAIALWVLFSHCFDSFEIAPILAATSPTPECGKTTLLTLLGALVARPLPASNISSAVVYRCVDKWQPTLIVDEADTFLKTNDELRGILNCGHNRRGAYVLRNVGDNHEPKQFSTWAPKAVAMIGRLPATLYGRSIRIELQRKTPDETVDPLRQDRLTHLEPLQRKAARWAADHADSLKAADPDMPEALFGRTADNWRALIAIADEAGGEWPARARRIAEAFAASTSEETKTVVLLGDLKAIFAASGADAMHTDDILSRLWDMEDRAWNEWGRGRRPMTKNQLATLLKSFGVSPKQVWAGGTNKRGYTLKALNPHFARYIPSQAPEMAFQSDRVLDPLDSKELRGIQSARASDGLALQKALDPLDIKASSTLALQKPENGVLRECLSSEDDDCPEPGSFEPDCPEPPQDIDLTIPAFMDRRRPRT